jgi:hypothetical protein
MAAIPVLGKEIPAAGISWTAVAERSADTALDSSGVVRRK